MSTQDNGLADVQSVTARTKTWATGQQITSADLNAIQDDVIAASGDAQDANERIAPSRSSAYNLAESPAPNEFGGGEVWVDWSTNGTTVVELDDSIDWRQRYIIIEAVVAAEPTTYVPGDTNDNNIVGEITTSTAAVHQLAYTEAGQTGSANNPGLLHTLNGTPEKLRVFADSTTGALKARMDAYTATNYRIQGRISFSPYQNH